jgi:hypothetical protein
MVVSEPAFWFNFVALVAVGQGHQHGKKFLLRRFDPLLHRQMVFASRNQQTDFRVPWTVVGAGPPQKL